MPETGPERHPQVITLSTLTIVKVAVFMFAIAFVYLIRDIVALFFVSLVLASVINPLAAAFQAKKMPRALAVLLLYAGLIGLVAAILVTLVPAVAAETRDLIANADVIWARFVSTLGPLRDFVASHGLSDDLERALSGATGGVGATVGGLVATIRGLARGVVSSIVVMVVAFYLVVSEDALKRLFRAVAPEQYQPYLVDLFQRVEKSIGGWARGQLMLSAIMAVGVYIGLKVLGVPYALVLALTAGVAESIPYVGPVMAAIPAILIAFTHSPLLGLIVAILYIVIQQIESHILVPKIMSKVTGLHPIVCIFALLIGVKVAGLLGALLAIPVAMMLGIVAADVFRLIRSNR